MKLVIGLGNPGKTYEGSRHNMGFDTLDFMMEHQNLSMTDQKFNADYTIWHQPVGKALLMKPYTYMNLSGEALLPMMAYYGIGLDDILVISDDLDLDVGKIRFRKQGSSGGQRGIQNIIDLIGSNEFKRLKIGIGRPQGGWKVKDHVLAPFSAEERPIIDEAIERASKAISDWISGEAFDSIMQKYN